MYEVDLKGTLTFVESRDMSKMLGYDENELIGYGTTINT